METREYTYTTTTRHHRAGDVVQQVKVRGSWRDEDTPIAQKALANERAMDAAQDHALTHGDGAEDDAERATELYNGSLIVPDVLKHLQATTGRWAMIASETQANATRYKLEKLGWTRTAYDPWFIVCDAGTASWDAKARMFVLVMGKAERIEPVTTAGPRPPWTFASSPSRALSAS